ncbi:MAG: prepilin-type N-terminal cleavage/methylation domain-containing protein [Geobacter sp.]
MDNNGGGDMKSNKGFSLTELIVIVAIIATLGTIATLNFSQWQRKYAIEAQTKEMLADLSNVRMQAIQTKREHRVFLNPQAYTTVRYEDTEAEAVRIEPTDGASGGVVVSSMGQTIVDRQFRRTLRFGIQQYTAGVLAAFSDTPIIINSRGYVTTPVTIAVAFNNGSSPAYDCLVITDARINIGRINTNDNTCQLQ